MTKALTGPTPWQLVAASYFAFKVEQDLIKALAAVSTSLIRTLIDFSVWLRCFSCNEVIPIR